jgi:hypothetical protein
MQVKSYLWMSPAQWTKKRLDKNSWQSAPIAPEAPYPSKACPSKACPSKLADQLMIDSVQSLVMALENHRVPIKNPPIKAYPSKLADQLMIDSIQPLDVALENHPVLAHQRFCKTRIWLELGCWIDGSALLQNFKMQMGACGMTC